MRSIVGKFTTLSPCSRSATPPDDNSVMAPEGESFCYGVSLICSTIKHTASSHPRAYRIRFIGVQQRAEGTSLSRSLVLCRNYFICPSGRELASRNFMASGFSVGRSSPPPNALSSDRSHLGLRRISCRFPAAIRRRPFSTPGVTLIRSLTVATPCFPPPGILAVVNCCSASSFVLSATPAG